MLQATSLTREEAAESPICVTSAMKHGRTCSESGTSRRDQITFSPAALGVGGPLR